MSRILNRTWYNSRFIIIMFIAYVDQGVGGRSCVSVVLRQYLSASASYVSGHVVDHKGDYYSFVESSIVHFLNIGLVRLSCGVISCSVPDPS
jgi:hypothetical protein